MLSRRENSETTPAFLHKGLLIDGPFAGPRVALHLRNRSVYSNGSAAAAAATAKARKNAHHALPGQASRSYNLTSFTIESFGGLGKASSKFVDQLASSVV